MAHATQVGIDVRELRGVDELRAAQALQRRAWGITEDGYVVPVATMVGVQKMGGLVLGAFDPQHCLVGFAFAFLGRLRGELVLYSQLAAVDPERQSSGIGRLLKLEQRQRAREMGLSAVVWAFDPLQASNAAFNLSVLGACCRQYEVDLYGSRSDALNTGLATDRLVAEWSTRTEPAPVRDAWADAPDVIEAQTMVPCHRPRPLSEHRIRIQIPADLQSIKRQPDLARQWQISVRRAFQTAFAAGYVAVGFTRAEPAVPRYLLERRA